MIELSPLESDIVAVLLEAAKYLDGSRPDSVIRIAGGWVRDKLLGIESCDIDIALEDTSGAEFATRVNGTLSRLGYEEHSIGVIQANPGHSIINTTTFYLTLSTHM